MQVHDCHIHSDSVFDGEAFLRRLESVGVGRATIFSEFPLSFLQNRHEGKIRLDNVLKACEPYPCRLLPVLWVHPDEPDVIELIQDADARGIAGYKCICNNFYVGEEKSLRVLEAIAKTGKPVMFHSGILWDDSPSSKYNRPLNWEELLNRKAGTIERLRGLRFSLAHVSWPWYDECIALYGKYMANFREHPEDDIEMYIDLTPGTPVSYRRDMFSKLLNCGYDIEHNILWGTDCNAEDYTSEWTRKWLGMDNAIMDEMRIPGDVRELIFWKNAMRFYRLPGYEDHKLKTYGYDGKE